MWCSTCQQDVPAVAHSVSGRTVCARCQRHLHAARSEPATAISDHGIALDELPATAGPSVEPPVCVRDWRADERVAHLGRALRRAGVRASSKTSATSQRRFDPPENLRDEIGRLATSGVKVGPHFTARTRTARQRSDASGAVSWLLVGFGALALVGGVGMMGWSLWMSRSEFWNPSLGMTLAGQGLLIFGLVLVVSRLWRNSRYATGKLQEVHSQLGQVQRTADALSSSRAGGAPAFYAELVRGASPQMLLSNLKGQLDQLSTRLDGQ